MIAGRVAALVLTLAAMMMPRAADAADGEPAQATSKRFVVAPTITLSDMGLDTNILTTAHGQKRDTTANLTLQLRPSVPLGPLRVSGRGSARIAYYHQSVEERSLDTDDSLRLDVRAKRVAAYVFGTFLRTRDPFDPEVYARTQRTEHSVGGGGEIRLTGKTQIGVAARETHVDFDATAVAFGEGVRQTLNRREDSLDASLRNAVTRLTTVVVKATIQRDRFDFTSFRDADGMRVVGGLEFEPTALIAGKAHVGYRRFASLGATGPTVSRLVGSVDLTYTLSDSFRCAVRVERDLAHSFRLTEPYFTLNDVSGSVTRRVNRAWDLTAYAGRQWLKYGRGDLLAIPAVEQAARDSGAGLDDMFRYGGGATYRTGRSTTVGIRGDYYRVRAAFTGRKYDRLRLVSSIEYGF